jgi:hypothetical protein
MNNTRLATGVVRLPGDAEAGAPDVAPRRERPAPRTARRPAAPPTLHPPEDPSPLGQLSATLGRVKKRITPSRPAAFVARSVEINTAVFHSARQGQPLDPADFKESAVSQHAVDEGAAAGLAYATQKEAEQHARTLARRAQLEGHVAAVPVEPVAVVPSAAAGMTPHGAQTPDKKMDRLAKKARAHAVQSEWVDGVSNRQKTDRGRSLAASLYPTRLASAMQRVLHPGQRHAAGVVGSDDAIEAMALTPLATLPNRSAPHAIAARRSETAWTRWIEQALPAQTRAQAHNARRTAGAAEAMQLPDLDRLGAERAATERVRRALGPLGSPASPRAREAGVLIVQTLHRLGITDAEQAGPILEALGELNLDDPARMHSTTPEAATAWRAARSLAITAPGFDALKRLHHERRPRNPLGDLLDVPPEQAHRRDAQRMMLQAAERLEPSNVRPAVGALQDPSPAAVIARHRPDGVGDPAHPDIHRWRAAPLAWRSGEAALAMLRVGGSARLLHADAVGDFVAWHHGSREDGPHSDYAMTRGRLHKFTAQTIPRVAQSSTRRFIPRLFGKRRSPLSALAQYGAQGVPRKAIKAEHRAMLAGIAAAIDALPEPVRLEARAALPDMKADDAIETLASWAVRAGTHATPEFRAALAQARRLAHPGEIDAPPVPVGVPLAAGRDAGVVVDDAADVDIHEHLSGDDPVSLARRTLQATARALPSSSRLRLTDGNRIGISTRGLSANIGTAIGLTGIPVAPRLDLRASRQREAVVEMARNTQGVDVFIGTTDTIATHAGGGVLVGYDVDVGLAQFRAGVTVQGVAHSDVHHRPRGAMLRVARRVAASGTRYDDARMLAKSEQVVSHLFDESLRLNGQAPLDAAEAAPLDAAEAASAEGVDAHSTWNRLAQRFIDDPDISLGWVDSRSGQEKHGISADVSPSFRMFGPASWLRLGANAGAGYEYTSRRWHHGDEHSGQMQVTQHRIGNGHRLIARMGGTVGGTSEARAGNDALGIGLVSLDAPSISAAFGDRSRQAKVQLVRENGRLVSRACLVDLEYTDAKAYCAAMNRQRPRWIAYFASEAEAGTPPDIAHALGARRFAQHLSEMSGNSMPNQTYFHRWRLRRDKAEEIDGLSAMATAALADALAIEKSTQRPPNGRLQRRAPPDPRFIAAQEAHNAFQAQINEIVDDPEAWIPIELKGKERSRQSRSPGVNFALQWNTTSSAVGERELFSEAAAFSAQERLDPSGMPPEARHA